MEKQQIKPSGWFYVLGLAIFLFGCLAATVVFALGIAGTVDSAVEIDRLINDFDRVVMPGSAQLELGEKGPYIVFYEYRGSVDGVPFSASRTQPLLNCRLETLSSGERVPLTRTWQDEGDYELPNRAGTALMWFQVDRPATYVFTCDYTGSGEPPQVVLAVGTGLVRGAVKLAVSVLAFLFGPILLVLGAGLVSVVVVVIVAVMRNQSARRIREQAS